MKDSYLLRKLHLCEYAYWKFDQLLPSKWWTHLIRLKDKSFCSDKLRIMSFTISLVFLNQQHFRWTLRNSLRWFSFHWLIINSLDDFKFKSLNVASLSLIKMQFCVYARKVDQLKFWLKSIVIANKIGITFILWYSCGGS